MVKSFKQKASTVSKATEKKTSGQFPVLSTAKRIYQQAFSNPVRFIKMWSIGTLLMVAATFAVGAFFTNTPNQIVYPIIPFGILIVILACAAFVHSNFIRFSFTGKAFAFKFDKPLLSYVFRYLLIVGATVGFGALIGAIAGFGGQYLLVKAYTLELVGIQNVMIVRKVITIVIAVLLGIPLICLYLRSLLALPAAFKGQNVTFHQSFSLTKGATLRLLGVWALVLLPSFLLTAAYFYFGWFMTGPVGTVLYTIAASLFVPLSALAVAEMYGFFTKGAAIDATGKKYQKVAFVKTLASSYQSAFAQPLTLVKGMLPFMVLLALAFVGLLWLPGASTLFMLIYLFAILGSVCQMARLMLSKKSVVFVADKGFWRSLLRHGGALVWSMAMSLSGTFVAVLFAAVILVSLFFEVIIQAYIALVTHPQLFQMSFPKAQDYIILFTLCCMIVSTVLFFGFFARYTAFTAAGATTDKMTLTDSHAATKGNAVRLFFLFALALLPFILVTVLSNILVTTAVPFAVFIAVRAIALLFLAPVAALGVQVLGFTRAKTK